MSAKAACIWWKIPTRGEIHDNIVAFWRPKAKLNAKGEYNFTYRLHWCNEAPGQGDLARVTDTRSGAATEKTRLFVLDIVGPRLKTLAPDVKPVLAIGADHGRILNPVVQPNPQTGGWRASFEMAPDGAKTVEMRAQLTNDSTPLSEAWVYRWTA